MTRGFRKSQIVFYGVLAAGLTLAGTNLASAAPRPHGKSKHAAEANDTNPAGAKIGEHAPDFSLKDCEGKTQKLSDYTKQGKIVVLEWFNPDCPFIKLHHEKQTTVVDLNKTYAAKDVVILSINSSSSGKEGYGKDADAKKNWKISWPILIDSDGKVGHMYGAKTTPHMFIIDPVGRK
jgi:peroxiredoxin